MREGVFLVTKEGIEEEDSMGRWGKLGLVMAVVEGKRNGDRDESEGKPLYHIDDDPIELYKCG